MRSAVECLAKAVDMERLAGLCAVPNLRVDLLSMAETWRHIAQQALWQDAVDVALPVA